MKKLFFLLRYPLLFSQCILLSFSVNAQLYNDYYGNGHNTGIKVKSSDQRAVDVSTETLTGTGIKPDIAAASRFLSQATLGHTYDNIEALTQTSIEAWIDAEINMPYVSFVNAFLANRRHLKESIDVRKYDQGELNTFTFYTKILTEEDKLRQKMANALLQVLVISLEVPQIESNGYAAATYYDIFYKGAFGNFHDILREVALHPMMGIYLSHFRNAQANYTQNTYPDENFAREIMQLFSIGLVQLNIDGTPRLDSDGKEIPTYDNDDIREVAKVFTGLAGAEREDGSTASFSNGTDQVNLFLPMQLYPREHDITEKRLINGMVLPAGRSGMEDFDATIELLFNHPNVGPFLAIRLIQNFVKSNPSPAYVERVATIFNDNGQGIRGDIGAMIKAILMDPEARDCDWIGSPQSGKLIQPFERFTKLFCAFKLRTNSGKFFMRDNEYSGKLGQAFFRAPSVFNFFTPFFAEEKTIKPAGLVSPEFEIFNSVTSVDYFNQAEDRIKSLPFENKTAKNNDGELDTNGSDVPSFDFRDQLKILDNGGISALLNHLDLLLCRGQLSYQANSIIQNTLQQYQANISNYSNQDLIKDAVYFITVSPDFIIQN